MDRNAILKDAYKILELDEKLNKIALVHSLEHGYVNTENCPLRPTGQHRILAEMLGGVEASGYTTCPFCGESWAIELAADYGDDW